MKFKETDSWEWNYPRFMCDPEVADILKHLIYTSTWEKVTFCFDGKPKKENLIVKITELKKLNLDRFAEVDLQELSAIYLERKNVVVDFTSTKNGWQMNIIDN